MMAVLPERRPEVPAAGCQTVPVPPLARSGSSGAEPPRPSVSLPPSPAGSLPAGAPLPCFLSRRLPLLAPSLEIHRTALASEKRPLPPSLAARLLLLVGH